MKRTVGSNPLSTKNATELPKCSKSLHFPAIPLQFTGFLNGEEKANMPPEIICSVMSLPVFHGLSTPFRAHRLGSSGWIWQMRCSFRGRSVFMERSA